MEAIKKKIETNRSAIIRELDLSKDFLAQLSRTGVIDITTCVKLTQEDDTSVRNAAFIDILLKTEDDTLYLKLLECLERSGQTKLVNRLTDVGEEMTILSQMQSYLEMQLKEMNEFLSTEERRTGIYLTEPPPEGENNKPALNETDVWNKVQESIKRAQKQLGRCQAVIQKLHQDCETVAKQNADIIEYTKECDAKIKAVLTNGRKSAKKATVPKRTQDLFAHLMDDIEKLVKTRRKVVTMETEGRRHSTRIVRQCRDWLEGRSVALQKLNSSSNPSAFKTFGAPGGEGEIVMNSQRTAPPINDNAIMSILDSLQLLEQELQEYIHQEVTATDKYRSEMRRKHLDRKVHGFNVQGFRDMEAILNSLEKDPEFVKDNVAMLKSCLNQINKEYGECMVFINKLDSDNSKADAIVSPKSKKDEPKTRDWPTNFKKKQTGPGGKLAKSNDTSIYKVGLNGKEKSEPNQLLDKVKQLVGQYEELKSEDLNLSSKYRIELSKRKREMDIALQRKEDQVMRLQTQLKETEAEKDKFKKLYNDTKIGYQRNHNTES